MIWFAVTVIVGSTVVVANHNCCRSNITSLDGWPEVHPPKGFRPDQPVRGLPPFHTPQLQSPINIRDVDAVKTRLPPLTFHDLLTEGVLVTMTNTGKTVNFEIDEGSSLKPRIVGGPLTAHGEFEFVSLHIHWGQRDFVGGEHKINNQRFAIEGHSVHFNLKYRNMEEAGKHSDGLAVIAFFVESGDKNNKKLDHLISHVPNITFPGASITLPAKKSLNWFADLGESKHYFTYPGSLTTPPYTENVFWIVYPDTMKLGTHQVEAFRNILSTDLKEIKKNIRPTQPFNNRPLIYNV